jgi:hypothetical protein
MRNQLQGSVAGLSTLLMTGNSALPGDNPAKKAAAPSRTQYPSSCWLHTRAIGPFLPASTSGEASSQPAVAS